MIANLCLSCITTLREPVTSGGCLALVSVSEFHYGKSLAVVSLDSRSAKSRVDISAPRSMRVSRQSVP